MAETFNCPTCGGPLEYTRDTGGTIRCPHCFNTVIVPEEIQSGHVLEDSVSTHSPSQPSSADILPVDLQLLKGEILELLVTGQKINAIKKYRQATGVGLREAKDAVESLEAGGELDAHQLSHPARLTPTLRDDTTTFGEAAQLIRDGKKIEAIKLLRQRYDLSLRVAKDAADRLGQGQAVDIEWLKLQANRAASSVQKHTSQASNQASSSFLPWGCILLAALMVVVILLAVFLPTLLR